MGREENGAGQLPSSNARIGGAVVGAIACFVRAAGKRCFIAPELAPMCWSAVTSFQCLLLIGLLAGSRQRVLFAWFWRQARIQRPMHAMIHLPYVLMAGDGLSLGITSGSGKRSYLLHDISFSNLIFCMSSASFSRFCGSRSGSGFYDLVNGYCAYRTRYWRRKGAN